MTQKSQSVQCMRRADFHKAIESGLGNPDPLIREAFGRDREVLQPEPEFDYIYRTAAGLISRGNAVALSYLIDQGLHVNACSHNQKTTLLMSAAATGNLEILQMLVERGAQIGLVDDDSGCAALHAARNGHLQCLQFLCARGADIHQQDKWGYGFLDRMHIYDARDEVRLLSSAQKKGVLDSVKFLSDAQKKGVLDCIKFLIDSGLDPERQTNRHGTTALIQAIKNGFCSLAGYLVDLGVDVNKPCLVERASPLSYAAAHARTDLMRKLIQAGANVNAMDKNGNTPLVHACLIWKNAASVAMLLEAGADAPSREQVKRIRQMGGDSEDALALIAAHQARMAARQSILEVSNLHPRPA